MFRAKVPQKIKILKKKIILIFSKFKTVFFYLVDVDGRRSTLTDCRQQFSSSPASEHKKDKSFCFEMREKEGVKLLYILARTCKRFFFVVGSHLRLSQWEDDPFVGLLNLFNLITLQSTLTTIK